MISKEEQLDDLETMVKVGIEAYLAEVNTSIPAKVVSWNPAEDTIFAQPAIRYWQSLPDGSGEWIDPPMLIKCPVVRQQSGDFAFTTPISAGDDALIVFSQRYLDGWWESGNISTPKVQRMHDWSDGFAIVGPASIPNVMPSIQTDAIEMRNRNRSAYIKIDSGGNCEIQCTNLNVIGNITSTGTLFNNGLNVGSTHTHSGVTSGLSNTGPPT